MQFSFHAQAYRAQTVCTDGSLESIGDLVFMTLTLQYQKTLVLMCSGQKQADSFDWRGNPHKTSRLIFVTVPFDYVQHV